MPDVRGVDPDAPASQFWPLLALRLAIVALPLWLTVSILISNVDWPIKLIVGFALGLTLARPDYGLILIALFAPLASLLAPMIGTGDFRIGEAVVLAFFVGWLLRALPDRRGPRSAAPAAGWLLATTVVASIAGLAWQLGRYPGEFAAALNQIGHMHFFVGDRIGFAEGAQLLEGLGLVAATVILFRRSPSLAVTLPLALAFSGAAAALSSVLLWRGIGSAAALARYQAIGYRVAGHVGDVNAAGSYFAMILCLALGMAMRERGSRRAIWLGFAAANGIGLWFSESRSAVGAAGGILIVAAVWVATTRFGGRARTAVLTAVVVAILGGGFIRARLLEADPTYRGGGFRQQFFQTSLRMIGARPLFGVGEGQYYPASPMFLSPQLAWTYGFENAHNYFLQVGGELGLVGLGLFLLWIGSACVRTARALARSPLDGRLLGVGGGVMVFIATCLSGHPLLVGEVAYPFWMQFGLMSALAGSTLLNDAGIAGGLAARPGTPRAASLLVVGAALVILMLGPVATAGDEVRPPQSQAVDGFYPWEQLEDGTRFRWTGEYASLFVPADVTRVEIPIRLPTDGRSVRAMGVEVMTAGLDRGRTMVDATWTIVSLRLADGIPHSRFKRIDLKVDRVWQPALGIAGSADLRSVGVQVGEPRLIRE